MNSTARLLPSLALLATLALGACGDDDATGPSDPPEEYTVSVLGQEFVVRVATQAQIDAMETRLASGVEGVINGRLLASDGQFNVGWSWHMAPASVEVVDMSIELCDGTPQMVEADLDYWLDTVGRFCPWSAVVTGRR